MPSAPTPLGHKLLPARVNVKPLFRRIGIDLNLDHAVFDANRVAADLEPRVVGPGTIGEAEPPGVPGAGDNAVLDITAAQRGAHVRTDVVNGEVPTVIVKESDEFAADLDC